MKTIALTRLLRRARSVASGCVPISREALDHLLDRLEAAYVKTRLDRVQALIDELDGFVLGEVA